MHLRNIGRTLVCLVAVGLITAVTAAEAQASWGSWGSRGYGSSGGSWGSWGSGGGSWGSSGGSWGSFGSRGGPIRNLIHRVRAHHASYGSHGSRGYYSSGGSWGSRGYASYGSSGGYRYYSSSGGSHGYTYVSTGNYYSTPTYSAPVIYQPGQMVEPASTPVAPEAADPGPEANSGNNYARRDAVLNLRLPESAVVYVNGKKTKTPGTFRSYVSKNLQVGKNYSYQVRIELDQDGETLTRTKVVELTAGANKTFDIDFDVEPELITSLTLFVPDDAKVELGGAETAATGPMRYFSTKSLGKGQSWNDYVVSVTITRDGQKVTKNRVIDVQAGESVDLRFDFEGENSVASR